MKRVLSLAIASLLSTATSIYADTAQTTTSPNNPAPAAATVNKTAPTPAASNTAPTVNPADRAKIESVIHDYLLKKPEVLVEALQILQRKQYEQAEQTIQQTQKSAATFADALFHQASDPIAGNPDGSITITEFFDYQCPHCVEMAPVITDIIKSNPDVRVVYKEFPIRGPMSETAARAALAANLQGKYLDFNHALLAAQQPLTEDFILQTASKVGLDVDKLKKDMGSPKITAQLLANQNLGKNLKLFGTPAFFVGKTKDTKKVGYFPGQLNKQQMQDAITQAGQG